VPIRDSAGGGEAQVPLVGDCVVSVTARSARSPSARRRRAGTACAKMGRAHLGS